MRFLFFDDKKICYDSPQFFIAAMAEELTRRGHDCIVCHLTEKPDLEALTRIRFDGIFAFNSKVPQFKLSEQDYYLDHLQGPFYNWLLDHPLYHHPSLVSGARNHHVLTLDEKHTEYLKRYYPNLASVRTQPLFTMPYEEERIKPLRDRPIPLLFTGTYTSQEMLERKMQTYPEDAGRDILELIDIMENDCSLSAEEALAAFINRRGGQVSDDIFREFLWRYYLADTAVAARAREKVVEALLSGGVSLTVCGHGWDKLRCQGRDKLVCLPERSYGDSLALAYDAQILLNIMPNFRAGLHDRVLTAMGHGAVCLTDETAYLNRYFEPGSSHLSYRLDEEGRKQLVRLAQNPAKEVGNLQKVADRGRELAKERTIERIIEKNVLAIQAALW